MSAEPQPADPDRPPPEQARELDATVANIELTVISIVQGMALSFLIEGGRSLFVEVRLASLPYIVSGLLVAFSMWSRAVLHAFTVIRWPLELGHNFIYFVAALCEAALFSQAGRPERWYPVGLAMVALFWGMFFYERRMYRLRRRDSTGPASRALLDVLEAEHELNIRRLMPALLLVWGSFTALVFARPDLFIARGWHVALGALQVVGLLGYLRHVSLFYLSVIGRIVAARAEWA